MYIQLNKQYLEENEKEMIETAKENECEDALIVEATEQETYHDIEFDHGKLMVNVKTELGWISCNVPIDDDLAFQIVDYVKMKGKKIKRLINIGKE